MTDFDSLFYPVLEHYNLEYRPQQRHLGWAVVDSIATEKNLIGEARTGVGKSMAYLVPLIDYVKQKVGNRAVVSTETTALQDQLFLKDLPMLAAVYDGFTYYSLKGRSHYFCANRARMNMRYDNDAKKIVPALITKLEHGLGEGEQSHCEAALKQKISLTVWRNITGTAEFCADNKCKPEDCMSTRARAKACEADIVVVNHSLLITDAAMRESRDATIFGAYGVLVIDEAHTLEKVLIDDGTVRMREVDIYTLRADVLAGLVKTDEMLRISTSFEETSDLNDVVFDNLAEIYERTLKMFHGVYSDGGTWERDNWKLSAMSLPPGSSDELIELMYSFEKIPDLIEACHKSVKRVEEILELGVEHCNNAQVSGVRKIRKAARGLGTVKKTLNFILEAMSTKDGIVLDYGVPHGVAVHGALRDKTIPSLEIHAVPLDVSARCASMLWPDVTTILVSATLLDPTSGTFSYVVKSLGLDNYQTVTVDSPFAYAKQQLVYTTPGTAPIIPISGARFSIEELTALVMASNGRALILFTARAELDFVYQTLIDLQLAGNFNYAIHYQDRDASKADLVHSFKTDEHSILLATKSFFVGTDFPGTTCSLVVLCKFPLPQFNTLCRQQIDWWTRRGFANWYDRESLTVFAQAAGRLIRSETDYGVVAVLDQRVADRTQKVHRTAMQGIDRLGSRVTSELEEVTSWFHVKEGM